MRVKPEARYVRLYTLRERVASNMFDFCRFWRRGVGFESRQVTHTTLSSDMTRCALGGETRKNLAFADTDVLRFGWDPLKLFGRQGWLWLLRRRHRST
jgi:hypothetical protein